MTEINLDEEIEFYFEELLEYDSIPDQTLKTIYATGFKDCLRMLKAKDALKIRVEE